MILQDYRHKSHSSFHYISQRLTALFIHFTSTPEKRGTNIHKHILLLELYMQWLAAICKGALDYTLLYRQHSHFKSEMPALTGKMREKEQGRMTKSCHVLTDFCMNVHMNICANICLNNCTKISLHLMTWQMLFKKALQNIFCF